MTEHGWPPVAGRDYEELRPVLALVRVMRRFLDEVIEPHPELNRYYAEIDCAYAELLHSELAPHAYAMAAILVKLERAYAPDRVPTPPL